MNDINYNMGDNRQLTNHIIDFIEEASTYIKACNLFFDDTHIKQVLLDACRRGVAVFILTNLQGTIKEQKTDKKTLKKVQNSQTVQNFAHGKAIEQLFEAGAHISGLDGLHAKFMLSDGKKAIITSANFTGNSINKITEAGVDVKKTEYDDLEKIFDYLFMSPDKFAFSHSKNYFTYERPTNPINVEFFNRDSRIKMTLAHTNRGTGYALSKAECNDLRDEIFNIINGAKSGEDLYLVTYSLDFKSKGANNNTLEQAIRQAKRNNVSVHILCRSDKASKLHGFKIYEHANNHAKFVLTKKRGILFTGNLTDESFHQGFDLGITLNEQQIAEALIFIDKLFKQAKL